MSEALGGAGRPPQTPRRQLGRSFFGYEGTGAKRLAALLMLVVAPLIVHFPELAGWISCAPMIEGAGLAAFPPKHLLSGLCFIDGNAGGTLEALGHLSAESWLHGELPWWNSYNGVGTPLAAEMQPASFFLPFILLLHFPSGILLLRLSTQIMAGVFMFACLRELRIALLAAVAGGLLFEFNGTFAWYSDSPALPIAFLPLLVAGIERARSRAESGEPGGIPAIALGIGFSLLAGFPETAFMDGLLALLWCFGSALRLSWPARKRMACKVVIGGGLGLCLAAPALIPFLEYLPLSSLQVRADVSQNQMSAAQAAAVILPTLFGPPYWDSNMPGWGSAGGYIGLPAVLTGSAWLLSGRRPGFVRWLAIGWTAFWSLVFLGEPVARAVWHHLPVVNQIPVTRYAMPSIEFLWCALAAFALNCWRDGPLGMRRAALLTVLAVLAALFAGIAANRINPALGWRGAGFACIAVVWALIAGVTLTKLLSGRQTPSSLRLAVALFAADACAAYALPIGAGMTAWAVDLAPIRFLNTQPGYFRSYGIGRILPPNYGAYFATPTLQLVSIPGARLWFDHASQLDPRLANPFLDLSTNPSIERHVQTARVGLEQDGVRFIMTARSTDPVPAWHDAHFQTVFESPTTRIYELKGAAPYFEIRSGTCTLSILSRVALNASCKANAKVERRELFFPGWHASVTGAKAPIHLADQIFQEIDLPAGESRVRFWYSPPHSSLIAWLLSAALAGLALAAVRTARSVSVVAPDSARAALRGRDSLSAAP